MSHWGKWMQETNGSPPQYDTSHKPLVFRDDMSFLLKLRPFDEMGIRLVVRGEYGISNIGRNKISWNIPFQYSSILPNRTLEGLVSLQPKDLIGINKVLVTKSGMVIDIGSAFNVYRQEAQIVGDRVELTLQPEHIPTFEINPAERVKVSYEYRCLSNPIDVYVHRIAYPTRNLRVELDYSEEDFSTELETFLTSPVNVINPGHEFECKGWILPQQGFRIGWRRVSKSESTHEFKISEKRILPVRLRATLHEYENLLLEKTLMKRG